MFATSTCCSRVCVDEAAALDAADRAAAGRLLRTLERQRARVRRTLLKALDGQRYDTLLDRFDDVLDDTRAERRTRRRSRISHGASSSGCAAT